MITTAHWSEVTAALIASAAIFLHVYAVYYEVRAWRMLITLDTNGQLRVAVGNLIRHAALHLVMQMMFAGVSWWAVFHTPPPPPQTDAMSLTRLAIVVAVVLMAMSALADFLERARIRRVIE